jgi:ATP-dependent DNA helicase RecQ
MDRWGIKRGTVLDHFLKYLQAGNPLRSGDLLSLSSLSSDQVTQVLCAFNRVGTDYLKPAFDALDGEIDYDELKVLRVYYLSTRHR